MHDSLPPIGQSTSSQVGPSRRGLIGRTALLGLGASPLIGFLAGPAHAAPQQSLDAASREAFRDFRSHENDHVAKLRAMLGSKARPKPTFKNLNVASFSAFVTLSMMLENTDSGAYLGALPFISSKDNLAAAASIALVEARHAGFVNVFGGKDNTLQSKDNKPSAVERPLTISEVVQRASPFIASLNGGPPLSFTPGDDVSIMNFALALEHLGSEFYNINVPKFVGT